MNAAIYARKSTEQAGVSDEEKSVARQIEHAKAYALKKGWTVPEELIFMDDGISGAEFVKRPGFIRLMNALKPRPSFHVLIMSEESRLGRESIETSYALKQIMDAGVRVFFYLEDRERTLDNAMDKVMLSLANFASEMERERAKQRTADAMLRKAKAGHVTGGKTYGYDNHEVLSAEGHRLHVLRVVNPKEAELVRQIFDMYAGGLGITRIAKRLNEEHVPAPRQSPRGWAPSAVREILHRELYQGQIVYGQLEKVIRGGTKRRRQREEKDWVRVDAPDLRIIERDIWESVQARLAKSKGKGRSAFRDLDSKYLLTGMARCAHCGGPMTIVGQDYHRQKGRFYGCSYYKTRGSSICKNSLLVEQEYLDQIVLKSLHEAVAEEMIKVAVEKALAKHRAGEGAKLDRQTSIERELSLINAKQNHLVDRIAAGDKNRSIIDRLNEEEARREALLRELQQLATADQVDSLDEARLKREMKARFSDLRGLLNRHVSSARRLLRVLMEHPLRCEAVREGDRKEYRVTGTGSYLPLLPETLAPLNTPEKRCSVEGGVPNGKFSRGAHTSLVFPEPHSTRCLARLYESEGDRIKREAQSSEYPTRP
ncbi:MAG: recombinase family protein [Nitrospira sp.]|nr:recombinase family protein [Nitrospira sp.]